MSHLTHYIDLLAIPQAEMPQTMVVSHLMQHIHRLLPPFKGAVAVGFPAYNLDRTLGGIIRLFGDQESISSLNTDLTAAVGIRDYAIIKNPEAIEYSNVKEYARFTRLRRKGIADLRRAEKRLSKRGEWSESVEQAMLKKWSKPLHKPHIHLKSDSTGQNFTLWIGKIPQPREVIGEFSSYGLSNRATVPIF